MRTPPADARDKRACNTRIPPSGLTALMVAACFALGAQAAAAHDAHADASQPVAAATTKAKASKKTQKKAKAKKATTAAAAAPFAGGMRVSVDPNTGAFVHTPGGTFPLSAAEQQAMSTSTEGLVARENTGPGGGMVMDLQGRFRSPLVVAIDKNGKTHMDHIQLPATTTEKKK